MTSFQLSVSPHRRAAARFVGRVRRSLQKAFAEETTVNQTGIANALGVHRSVINRQLRGYKDMSLSRAAELAWAMGREPVFDLIKPALAEGDNHAPVMPGARTRVEVTKLPLSITVAGSAPAVAPKHELQAA